LKQILANDSMTTSLK